MIRFPFIRSPHYCPRGRPHAPLELTGRLPEVRSLPIRHPTHLQRPDSFKHLASDLLCRHPLHRLPLLPLGSLPVLVGVIHGLIRELLEYALHQPLVLLLELLLLDYLLVAVLDVLGAELIRPISLGCYTEEASSVMLVHLPFI